MSIDLLCLCERKRHRQRKRERAEREREQSEQAMASTATILAVTSCATARESTKESEQAVPSMATILGVVILSMSMGMASASASASAWCWSTASLIFCRGIAFAAAAAERRDSESSSSSSSRINYEVFLSFRGTDTRKGFTGHLYSQLIDAGIHVFKDDENLRGGEEIKSQLKEVIKGSKISIAIFSKDYASSKSCLMEVLQMWECKIFAEQTIIPIFYDISPYDVRRQFGDFATSFDQHERVEDAETIKKWKNVLRKIGGLSGYHLAEINNGDESKLLKRVRRRVRQVLKKDDQVVTDKLVGIDLHVQEMMRKLGVVYSNGRAIDVCGQDIPVVGICGMPGIGKTTLAKVVFNKMHELFDECSFLEGINSKGVVPSQEMLIADLQKEEPVPLKSSDKGIQIISSRFERMKVLIVLDDVHGVEQLKALAGEVRWFGPGSRIIVTTDAINIVKDVHNGAVEEHKLTPLRRDHALRLFRKHAFQGYTSQKIREYNSLSMDIVEALGGHPLAIVLWASNLRRKEKKIWEETLDSLKENQGEEVEAAFEASYKSLEDTTKDIFLDIACFFIGKDKRIPFYMWQACRYCPHGGINQLRDKHLLEDGENNELRMHDLVRNFGRKLVQKKAPHERCRIWVNSDALKILQNRRGTGSVEGIGLTVEEGSTVCFTYEETHQMSNLRYLKLDRAKIQGNTKNLLPNLRWLDWRECHSIRELCNAHLEELVILNLSGSPIARDSQIWSRFEGEKKLKVLNLQGCVRLPASLNFRAPINLEILILEDCTWLSEIGPFIRKLKNLSFLNLRNCSLVKKLPQELRCMISLRELLVDGTGIKEIQIENGSWKKLEKLSACGCTELESISPIGHLKKLQCLALDGAKIDGLPDTFEFPHNLRRLSLRNCSMLEKLPPSIGDLGQLEVMDLSCTKIEDLPPSVKELRNLKTLKMRGTPLRKFPEDIMNLEKLEEIDFSDCTTLEGQVRCNISGLSSLRILRLSSSIVAGLPQNICRLSRLQTLDILECDRLQVLPELPSSLQSLRWGSQKMTVFDLSYLTNLKELLLKDVQHPTGGLLNLETPKAQDIGWITRLTSLETLELSLSNVTNLPRNVSALTQLRELTLSYMEELDLTQLPLTPSLSTVCLKHCKIQNPKISSLKYLSELELDDCDLAKIDGLENLKRLEILKILECRSITKLDGLENIVSLRKVQVWSTPQVVLPELSELVELDRCDY